MVMPGYKVWQRGRSGAGSQGSGLGPSWVVMPFAKPELVLGPVVSADTSLVVFQVNEIYHDESLGAHINVVLVRIILLSYGKVSGRCRLVPSRHTRAPASVGWMGPSSEVQASYKSLCVGQNHPTSPWLPCGSYKKQGACEPRLLCFQPHSF